MSQTQMGVGRQPAETPAWLRVHRTPCVTCVLDASNDIFLKRQFRNVAAGEVGPTPVLPPFLDQGGVG